MIPYEFNAERFSRWMAYVLRHNPERYGLQADRHGFVEMEAFLRIARHRYPEAGLERLRELITGVGSARFEVAGDRLRARYGHSIPVDPAGEPVEPPPQLFYGTDQSRTAELLAGGLRPTDRRLLHLSQTAEEAWSIARRKTLQPAVIQVDAHAAHQSGIAFYREGTVHLAGSIPERFLRLESGAP